MAIIIFKINLLPSRKVTLYRKHEYTECNQFSPWLSFQYIILMHLKVLLLLGFQYKPQFPKTTKLCIKNSFATRSSPICKLDISNPFSSSNGYMCRKSLDLAYTWYCCILHNHVQLALMHSCGYYCIACIILLTVLLASTLATCGYS